MISRSSLFAHYERAGRMSLMILLRLALALAVSAGLVAAAFAGERLVLKGDVTVAADILTLGDLVEGAPASAAATALFRAPGLGQTGTIQVRRILEAARPLGLAAIDAGGRTQIVVTRAARRIGAAEIEAAVKRALELQHRLDARALSITFDGTPPALTIAPDAEGDVVAEEITYDRRSRRLSALVAVGGNAGKASVRVTGVALEYVEAAVLTRALNRGDTRAGVRFRRRATRQGKPAGGRAARDARLGRAGRAARPAGRHRGARRRSRPPGDRRARRRRDHRLRGAGHGPDAARHGVCGGRTRRHDRGRQSANEEDSASAGGGARQGVGQRAPAWTHRIEPHGQAMITPVSTAMSARLLGHPLARLSLLAVIGFGLGGCAAADRLAGVGQPPVLSSIEDPTAQPGYKPVRMPMPNPQPVSFASNSLWRQGSRAFFKDQRAQQIGDLVTVRVKVTDQAQINNSTSRSRKAEEGLGAQNLFGLEAEGIKFLPDGTQLDALVNADSNSSSTGSGSIRRSEQLVTNVAAVVTQVLPNSNLVIEGKQEIRVNFEVRELIVAGVVRPEDIEADNTVDSTKIAQARIAYGGRGQITDVQQPRYGQQVMDILLPF